MYPSASQLILKGIPIHERFPNMDMDMDLYDLVSQPVGLPVSQPEYISATVCIPGEFADPLTNAALTRLNHFLIHTRYDFCDGVIQSAYIQSLQREVSQMVQVCPGLLPRKLDMIFEREYNALCYWYNSAYYSTRGVSTPSNFHQEYMDKINYYYRKSIELPDPTISPLDQFSITPYIPIHIGDFYFSFTNSSLFMLLTLGLFLLLVYFVTKKGGGNLVPNAWQSLVELLYDFVLNLVNEQIGGLSGKVKQTFFPCIFVTFTFLLFCNLQGMIPYSFTVTSHFLITLGLSFSLFIGITIVGFQRNGLHFLSILLPAGVPLPLAPFLVLLELISYCFRALSLGIRLFANMMAGHSLVKILSGFAWTMLCMNELLYFIGDLGPLFIVLALTGLELGVAILQAYVFTILICIYLNDAINLH